MSVWEGEGRFLASLGMTRGVWNDKGGRLMPASLHLRPGHTPRTRFACARPFRFTKGAWGVHWRS